jgi:hypothetical protein
MGDRGAGPVVDRHHEQADYSEEDQEGRCLSPRSKWYGSPHSVSAGRVAFWRYAGVVAPAARIAA